MKSFAGSPPVGKLKPHFQRTTLTPENDPGVYHTGIALENYHLMATEFKPICQIDKIDR
jgi:hypothetical protein